MAKIILWLAIFGSVVYQNFRNDASLSFHSLDVKRQTEQMNTLQHLLNPHHERQVIAITIPS